MIHPPKIPGTEPPLPKIRFRVPQLRDGAAVWRLAKDTQTLDLNSPYAYLLWCDRFEKTSLVAEVGTTIIGFMIGFEPPGKEGVLFVWQIAVSKKHRGQGLARKMLEEFFERESDFDRVEATVTPSNAASQRLFRSFARRDERLCEESEYLNPDDFPTPGHEAEVLFQIGPTGSAT